MSTLFALIMLLQGASDGGRAINTELRFPTRSACEAAQTAILQAARSETRFPPIIVCVEVHPSKKDW